MRLYLWFFKLNANSSQFSSVIFAQNTAKYDGDAIGFAVIRSYTTSGPNKM